MDGDLAPLAMKLLSSPLVRATRLGSALLALFLVPASLAQTTWYVAPGDVGPGGDPGSGTLADPYIGLQYAIDLSSTSTGDRIELLPGVYDGGILLSGKSLDLYGPSDDQALILVDDGQVGMTIVGVETLGTYLQDIDFAVQQYPDPGIARCVQIQYTAVELFRCEVRDGEVDFGGGIAILEAYVELRNCTVESCLGWFEGGGVHARSSSLVIENCQFLENGNYSTGGFGWGTGEGGHVWFDEGVLEILGTSFEGGYSERKPAIRAIGDHIRIEDTEFIGMSGQRSSGVGTIGADLVEFDGNLVLDCFSGDYGGGLGIGGGLVFISNCLFVHNGDSIGNTGALGLGGNLAEVRDCLFENNFSVRGGAVAHGGGHAEFHDCTFRSNRSREPAYLNGGDGGAFYAYGAATQEFHRCVFERNVAEGLWSWVTDPLLAQAGVGGALLAPNATLDHCTFFANECQGHPQGDTGPTIVAAALENCIVWGESPYPFELGMEPASVEWSIVQGDWPGEGNQDADPLFWLPDEGDLHLRPGSPAIDAGDPVAPLDADGSVSDVGAFPFDSGYTPAPATYCEPKVSSQGCVPVLSWNGVPSLSDPTGVQVLADQVDVNRWGLVLWAFAPDDQPFFGGTLCLGTGLERGPAHLSVPVGPGPCDGRLEAQLVGSDLALLGVDPGDSIYVQFWYRDNLAPEPVGLSGGLRLTWAP